MIKFNNDWDELLKDEFKKDYYLKIREFLKKEYFTRTVFPPMNDIFNAFKLTPLSDIKVVILGQDPYHEKGQAEGLCFSVPKGIPVPPSLVNIYKELNAETGFKIPSHGCLREWAEQGVMLLNTVLTVREGAANSHKDCGWRTFTDNVISIISKFASPSVFMLWGANAKEKESLIDGEKHLILKAAHPSPLSAHNGFFGCGHFNKANEFLKKNGKKIIWDITD